MKFSGVFLALSFLLLIISGCSQKNKFDVELEDIEVAIEVKRLDKELFELDPGTIEQQVPDLIQKYGEFLELYSHNVISIGSPYSKAYPDYLAGFITDYTMYQVHEKVMEKFPDVEFMEEELTRAFKYYQYYFPERLVPAVYTFQGGFNQSIVVADSILAIGTDKYLGPEVDFYDRLGISRYLQRNMIPEKIPSDALRAWAMTEFVYNDSIDNLVNNMIYQGKLQYFLDAMFPFTEDSLKFGFTSSQLEWCQKNEKPMWDNLVEQKLLFSTDYMTITNYIKPAPFTTGFPRQSPGRAVVWLGWKIVHRYMERHPEVTLKELMLNDHYQEILTGSRYEP
ncbi:MAG: hypothetical protein V2I54_14065 [Bacteroidales bacterium]|jgi:gliding motility-associated lipoprotein GldB|nr:hypothetical protein [Bacteroidales bacterium]